MLVRGATVVAAVVASVAAATSAGAAPTAVQMSVVLSGGEQSSATSGVLIYGGSVKFVGAVKGLRPGMRLTIATSREGRTPFQRELRPAADGSFTYADAPSISTRYRVRLFRRGKMLFDGAYAVYVRPRLLLRAVSPKHRVFSVAVLAIRSFAGSLVVVERRNSVGAWAPLKSVRLGAGSAARFVLRLPRGRSELRALLPAEQAPPGYAAGVSNRFFFRSG
jgi:hypothetical protein